MIYIKIQKDIYNNLTLDKLIKEYPLMAGRYLALHRIIFNTLRNDLKEYPEIDIVISNKRQNSYLGRFYQNEDIEHKEYKFIPQKSGNPYIVLFEDSILRHSYNHKVKGFKKTFLHEFYHFRQWLLNEPLEHNRILRAVSNPLKLEHNLKVISKALNLKVVK